ncbi:hypothetical protein Cme02nite_54560 [Catellatospora methionotrophica]|uniref:Antitoxin n=1 Tax=Catellatospora methionotrophica TaxID=121620 RepID=A0A8J3LK62_9ACTN|nr:hypothetical protein [Catellatospora methionotrophica]GIG17124.1 hypothetical protein Cme02nite_54560 [Catellatospora methionotrophica]
MSTERTGTDRTSVSLPVDLAEYARSKGNASQYIAGLIEHDKKKAEETEALHAMFERHGYTGDHAVTADGIAKMGGRLRDLEARRAAARLRRAA